MDQKVTKRSSTLNFGFLYNQRKTISPAVRGEKLLQDDYSIYSGTH